MKPQGTAGRGWLRLVSTSALVCVALAAAPLAPETSWRQFWDAKSPQEAEQAAGAIVKAGVGFNQALAELKKGRAYSTDVPRGILKQSRRRGDTDFPYVLEVPQSYDPAKKYQVRVQLHGGVSRPEPTIRGNGVGALAGAEQIYVLPIGWAAATWWSDRQIENVSAILDSVRRAYNVDENRIVLSGVSDGATGAYYVAMRDVTAFASFLPLNGALAVLRNPSTEVEGELFPNNFLNKPFFIVNGGRDPLYPASSVEPYIDHLKNGGVKLTYLPQPEGGHNTAWWPEVKDTFESFVRDHPRSPLPDTLTWESDLTEGTKRAHWLMIDALSKPQVQEPLPDLNDFGSRPTLTFGVQNAGMRITSVTAGSNAASFGLLPGDVVFKVNEMTLPVGVDLLELLSTQDPGRPMTFLVRRNNKSVELRGSFHPVMTAQPVPMFRHFSPSGRVDLERKGNTVHAATRGVAELTLLLSPDAFDFTKPVTVIADGRKVFEGSVQKSVATLLKWAARDNDRSMLFGAELHVKLGPPR